MAEEGYVVYDSEDLLKFYNTEAEALEQAQESLATACEDGDIDFHWADSIVVAKVVYRSKVVQEDDENVRYDIVKVEHEQA